MIEILPTRMIINYSNLDYSKIEKIKRSLSVWDKSRFRYSYQAFIEDEDEELICIPSCYDLLYIKSLFPDEEIIDNRGRFVSIGCKNKPINLKYQPRNELQKQAINFLKGNRFSRNTSQKLLSLNTGDGKTYCTVNYISQTLKRPIIFVDQEILAEQWINRIKEYTDTKDEEIFYISGKPSINKLLKKTKDEILNIKFFICIHRTIDNYINEDVEKFFDFFDHILVNTKIYDEAHVEYRSIWLIDSNSDCESIYLTATFSRSDPIENKVFQNMYHDIKRFTSNSLRDNSISNYHNIVVSRINSKPTQEDEADCINKYGFNSNSYFSYILNKKYDLYFEKITNILFDNILNKRNRKVAILLGINDAVDKFYDDIKIEISNRNLNFTVGKLNGLTKNKDEEMTKDIIITTDKSFSKAIDIANLSVLINLVPFSSSTKVIQTIGRLRRLDDDKVFYIDVSDIGFKNIQQQLNIRIRTYKKKAEKLYKLDLL